MLLTTYILLGLSICAVWAPPIAPGRAYSAPPWILLFVAATICGLLSGALTWHSLIPLALLVAASVSAQRCNGRAARTIFTSIAGVLALALALHAVPGFSNTVMLNAVLVSENAVPFTQYANFDKGVAGLILLAFFCQRVTSMADLKRIAVPTLKAILLTALTVFTLGVLARYIEADPKLPSFAPTFLAINLLFTCVAEEAFFRGLIQERLSRALASRWQWIAVVVASLLFGLAHFGGGLLYVALATVAGIGYSLAYAATRRIESAIFVHFAVNAVHFFGFTYPHLVK